MLTWKEVIVGFDDLEGIGTFSSTGEFNVSGDILSLVYENNPENKTYLS